MDLPWIRHCHWHAAAEKPNLGVVAKIRENPDPQVATPSIDRRGNVRAQGLNCLSN